jgi:phosphoribosylanthranilate isomerase
MVKVKICGITNWADARKAVEEGANFLGFNFFRKSPRYITPAAARRIISRLPKRTKAVGVFVNETEANILATARWAGLQRLQLHGDESPEMVKRLRREFPVIKAIRVRSGLQLSQLNRFAKADALLLDGFDGKHYGGTGKTFAWRVVRRVSVKRKLFLAGGLTPENVHDAIRIGKPYAVDVCSGVESRPGKKDSQRIVAFMRGVRSAGTQAMKPAAKHRAGARVQKKE